MGGVGELGELYAVPVGGLMKLRELDIRAITEMPTTEMPTTEKPTIDREVRCINCNKARRFAPLIRYFGAPYGVFEGSKGDPTGVRTARSPATYSACAFFIIFH